MQRIILFLIVGILSNINGCNHYKDPNCNEKSHNSVLIINNSKRNICFEFYWNYPDTMIGDYNPLNGGPRSILFPKDSFILSAGPRGCCCFESNYANGRKEWIYIFDADTINKLDWNTVRQTNRGLLERRLINLDYLESNNYKIIYAQP